MIFVIKTVIFVIWCNILLNVTVYKNSNIVYKINNIKNFDYNLNFINVVISKANKILIINKISGFIYYN